MNIRSTLHNLVSISPEPELPIELQKLGGSVSGIRAPTRHTPQGRGVFVTKESLVAFPVASAAVVMIWKVLQTVAPSWGNSNVVPLIVSFVVGGFLYWISVTSETTRREKLTAFGISVINSFYLTGSALGFTAAT